MTPDLFTIAVAAAVSAVKLAQREVTFTAEFSPAFDGTFSDRSFPSALWIDVRLRYLYELEAPKPIEVAA